MPFYFFVWDGENERHLDEHGVTPEEFAELARIAEDLGFKWVESAPLVRSSYHADGQARLIPAVPA